MQHNFDSSEKDVGQAVDSCLQRGPHRVSHSRHGLLIFMAMCECGLGEMQGGLSPS